MPPQISQENLMKMLFNHRHNLCITATHYVAKISVRHIEFSGTLFHFLVAFYGFWFTYKN